MKKYIVMLVCMLLVSSCALASRKSAPVNQEIPPVPKAEELTVTLNTYDLSFPEDMPEVVRQFVLTARAEFEAHPFERLPKANQYTKWYYEDNREIGWCSVFQIWCAYHSGLPLIRWNQGAHMEEECFSAMEGRVGNVYKAFLGQNRWLDALEGAVPKPGYLIIYGVRSSTPYTHIASVESVTELEQGVYELTTVEGNLGSTVRRLNFRYLTAPKRKYYNMEAIPEAERTREGCQYTLQKDTWYVTGFCETWP